MTSIEILKKHWAKISILENTLALLHWDMETYMPKDGVIPRSEQLAMLSELAHSWLISDETARIIENAEAEVKDEEYFSDNASQVRVAKRIFEKESKIPSDLVSRFAKTTALANTAWVDARKKSDFSIFQPILAEIIDLNREKAECLGYNENIYDALLDIYEPEMTASEVDKLFSKIKMDLIPLVKSISESDVTIDTSFLEKKYSIDLQEKFGFQVLKEMGYDLARGRQDRSVHPFTTSFSPYDVRITTRYSENDILSALFSTIHEAGHALYDQGLPIEHIHTPLCQSISLGVHESQSRLWENTIGRSRSFWNNYFPILKNYFPKELENVDADSFYRSINRVKPNLVRVESDEVTYNLHIFVRFEIENDLLNGRLKVKDIPQYWNAKYKEYLGIEPSDDGVGCLQDIHWAHGAFGYFPTYTIGNLLSAQIFEAAKEKNPSITKDIETGNFTNILSWLRKNIHNKGSRYTTNELVNEITGTSIEVNHFIDYLKNKYTDLYDL